MCILLGIQRRSSRPHFRTEALGTQASRWEYILRVGQGHTEPISSQTCRVSGDVNSRKPAPLAYRPRKDSVSSITAFLSTTCLCRVEAALRVCHPNSYTLERPRPDWPWAVSCVSSNGTADPEKLSSPSRDFCAGSSPGELPCPQAGRELWALPSVLPNKCLWGSNQAYV